MKVSEPREIVSFVSFRCNFFLLYRKTNQAILSCFQLLCGMSSMNTDEEHQLCDSVTTKPTNP